MDDKPQNKSAADQRQTNPQHKVTKSVNKMRKPTILLVCLILFVLAIAYLAWQSSQKTNTLTKQVTQLQNLSSQQAQQQSVTQLNTRVDQLAQELQQNQVLLHQLASNSQQIDEDWLAAKIDFLINTAYWSLNLSADSHTALNLLLAAQQILERMTNPKWQSLRQALVSDIAKLQALQRIDTQQLFTQLTQLNSLVNSATVAIYHTSASESVESIDVNLLTDKNSLQPSHWKQVLYHSWQELKTLVTIREYDQTVPQLINESQIALLKELADLLVVQAQLAVLRPNEMVYQTALQKLEQLIENYFSSTDQTTKNLLDLLKQLRAVNLAEELPTLDDTVKILQNIQQAS